MTYVKNSAYRDIPFCAETPYSDFYVYLDLKKVVEKCHIYGQLEIRKCRAIGILQSINGRFFLTDLDDAGCHSKCLVQVSVVYLKSPLQSTVVPYPVQVFGTLQQKNRPVIFAKFLQLMTVPAAIRLKNALSGITNVHLAKYVPEPECIDLT